jgi:hypothetical protein
LKDLTFPSAFRKELEEVNTHLHALLAFSLIDRA